VTLRSSVMGFPLRAIRGFYIRYSHSNTFGFQLSSGWAGPKDKHLGIVVAELLQAKCFFCRATNSIKAINLQEGRNSDMRGGSDMALAVFGIEWDMI